MRLSPPLLVCVSMATDRTCRDGERSWRSASSTPSCSPRIFTLGIEGLGPLTGEASGLLNTAIVGGAIIPLVQGFIADRIGIHHAFFLPAICYLYIVFFAFKGQPLKRGATAVA